MNRLIFIIIAGSFFLVSSHAHAWHDKTHIAVAKTAGYDCWYNAAGADIAKIKAGAIEEKNHYFNNYQNEVVTDKIVFDQVKAYNNPLDNDGHLYGAIIAALKDYLDKRKAPDKYAAYNMVFAVHYMGDLSQPLHNLPYDNFNKTYHSANDGIVDEGILDNHLKDIEKNVYEIRLSEENFWTELACEIARIANLSRQLGLKIKAENRTMTKEEAYVQLGHSASLLKAVLTAVR